MSTGDVYVLINANSDLAIGYAEGLADFAGNEVITMRYEKGLSGDNCQWYIEKTEVKEDPDWNSVPENPIPSVNYFVYYNPETQIIHFVAEDQSLVDTDVFLYSINGTKAAEFRSTGDLSVADLPEGVYILRWMEGNKSRSVKFVKR